MIVTGASSGIGRVTAVTLARLGYEVFGLARSYDKLKMLATQLPAENYMRVKFDITRPETFATIVDTIVADAGGIFGLINNAGYVEPGAIEDINMGSRRLQFETNFFCLVGLTKQILPTMMQRGEGRIINICSVAGLVSLPLIGAYCAAKHVLEAITDALRMELWNTEIKVVNINPGVVETNTHTITNSKVATLKKKSRFVNAYKKYLEYTSKGLPASIVANAIVKALSSPDPKSRYIIGSSREKVDVKL
jgi:short-subunit dehydrogenase